MKRFVWLAAALIWAVSCSPEIYTHYLEVSRPSESGIDLSGKSMAMVYMDGKNPADSAFNRSLASSLARALEEDYFGGEEVIGLYRIPWMDSLSLGTMHSLIMDTGEDVVFLLSNSLGEAVLEPNQEIANARSADSAYVCPAQLPLNTAVLIYDSMGEDVVRRYTGSTVLRPLVYNNGIIPEENLKDLAPRAAAGGEAERMGERIAKRFLSKWQVEGFSFYYFDDATSEEWIEGIVQVVDGNYKAAIDCWTPFVKGRDELRKACACYNIALVFFLANDLQLATRWLDSSDSFDQDLSLSAGLRSRIESRKK